jgi:hypothetical protein
MQTEAAAVVIEEPIPKKKRFRTHTCGHFIRKVKGSRYQVRWWLSDGGSINCGLYSSEWTASRVKREILHRVRGEHMNPLGLWRVAYAVIEEFRNANFPGLPTPLLPKFVHRRTNGEYHARVKVRGDVIVLPGPYATPEEAHHAMLDELQRRAASAAITG